MSAGERVDYLDWVLDCQASGSAVDPRRRLAGKLNFLAIDTSSNACSVALQTGGRVTHRHSVEPRAHTTVLIPMITELLAESDIRLCELNAVVLGNGPGSFIGMRIGASVAQGLSFGAGISIVPVSSLAAVASEAFTHCDADCVVVVQDARMNEVYMGVFERGDAKLPVSLGIEKIVAAGAFSFTARQYAAAGAGWDLYPDLKAANRDSIMCQVTVSYPDARHLLALGKHGFNVGEGVSPANLAPAYLRTKVADIPTRGN
ncbi:MAG: tRNA (adenosine(37)-N6)-threonylcarbamoyltransferase complex dimerization subunit type 1 TsaB [Woeseiaceae bacterium]